jgi:hypothetical protein
MSGLVLITKDAGLIAAFVATALAVLLGLMPPSGVDSLQVCRAIRCGETYVPTVMIIAPGSCWPGCLLFERGCPSWKPTRADDPADHATRNTYHLQEV